MEFITLSLLFLTIAIHKPVHRLVLGYSSEKLDRMHSAEDLFRESIENRLSRLDALFFSRWTIPIILTGVGIYCDDYLSWERFGPDGTIRFSCMFMAGFLCWKYLLSDIDLATGQTLYKERFFLLLSVIGPYLFCIRPCQ